MTNDPKLQEAIGAFMTIMDAYQSESKAALAANQELRIREVQALESIALNLGRKDKTEKEAQVFAYAYAATVAASPGQANIYHADRNARAAVAAFREALAQDFAPPRSIMETYEASRPTRTVPDAPNDPDYRPL
jgi:hypothetical protein